MPGRSVGPRRRLDGRFGNRAGLWVGDVTRIPARDGRYDAVLDWGVIHHIVDWKAALDEIARVLVPGGQFLFIEVPGHKIRSPHYRLLLDHPLEDRFELADFRRACEERGLVVGRRTRTYFGFFFGVAVRG
jgi:ubiquinone/menaquinone biosynthesis C-methylase UbiE